MPGCARSWAAVPIGTRIGRGCHEATDRVRGVLFVLGVGGAARAGQATAASAAPQEYGAYASEGPPLTLKAALDEVLSKRISTRLAVGPVSMIRGVVRFGAARGVAQMVRELAAQRAFDDRLFEATHRRVQLRWRDRALTHELIENVGQDRRQGRVRQRFPFAAA